MGYCNKNVVFLKVSIQTPIEIIELLLTDISNIWNAQISSGLMPSIPITLWSLFSPNGACHPTTIAILAPWPPNDISIKFEIIPKFKVLWFKMCSSDHNVILHTTQQLLSFLCKILLYSVEQILDYSTPNFYPFWNSIKIPLVGCVPGTLSCGQVSVFQWKTGHLQIAYVDAQSSNK